MAASMSARLAACAAMALVVLAGCAEQEEILPGARYPVGTPVEEMTGDAVSETAANRALPFAAGAPVSNADWTHRGGSPEGATRNLALGSTPAAVWSVPIGAGESRRERIAAAPVIASGRIYTLDSEGVVQATGTNGAPLWRAAATPSGGPEGGAVGGGLAANGQTVVVATGFGLLVALDAATGSELWQERFEAPIAGAPLLAGDRVYVQGRDGTGWAVDAASGRRIWVETGIPAETGLAGSAGPRTLGADAVLFALPDGVLRASARVDGTTIWQSSVPGRRPGYPASLVRDLTGDPAIAGGRVYAGTSAGRIAAIDAASGAVIWIAEEGAMAPIWVAGGSVFAVGDRASLTRIDAANGEIIWTVPLPGFERADPGKRKGIHAHFGPVLAGGRLVVASGDGAIRFFDPVDGRETGRIDLPGGAAAPPAIAGGTLYVVSRSGTLHAYR
jgi:outer membrane protein assembly factor BamB